MKRLLAFLAVSLLATFSLAQFPEFEQLPKHALFPRNAQVEVSPDGDLLVNGRVRYLLGTQIGLGMLQHEFDPTPGYAPEHRWIYEQPLTYEASQRLGFDTYAWFIPATPWITRHSGTPYHWHDNQKNRDFMNRFLTNRLPGLVDVTCFPWSFGIFGTDKKLVGKLVPEEAINKYHTATSNHWVPYNIMHPEGKKAYHDFWKYGCEFTRQSNPCQPLLFELFNEPAYDDPSPWNRQQFASYLQQQFGTIEELNRRWQTAYASFADVAAFKTRYDHPALSVAWGRMLEEAMTQLAVEGRDLVHQHLPGSLVCYQILGSAYRSLPKSNVNIVDITRQMDAVSLPTGGGCFTATGLTIPPTRTVEAPSLAPNFGDGLVMRHLFRTIAGHKPIHNPECYTGKSRQSKRLTPWVDFLRGSSATYLFCWSKRAWEWQGTEAGGRFIADKYPYILANPYAHPTDSLPGLLQAKNEIASVDDIFAPRANRPKAKIAIMLSFPTERYTERLDITDHHDIVCYANALEFTHHLYDVIPGDDIQDFARYQVIIAVGALNAPAETRQALHRFVSAGGILITARQALSLDEYGRAHQDGLPFPALTALPQPQLAALTCLPPFTPSPLLPGNIHVRLDKTPEILPGDVVLATAQGQPALSKRTIGKGAIYTIAPACQDYAAAAIVDAILKLHQHQPAVTATRFRQKDLEPNLEIHLRQTRDLNALAILNLDSYPKLTTLTLPGKPAAALDILQQRQLHITDEATVTLFIPANELILIACGAPDKLQQRFGQAAPPLTHDAVVSAYQQAHDQHQQLIAQKAKADFVFHADSTQLSPLNLRPFANSDFRDNTAAGDAKGGWLDQGRNHNLDNTPWDITTCLGIPCDFIRYDANDGKACIVLKSTSSKLDFPESIDNIPVNARIASLFLFHGAAQATTPGQLVMTYTVHYHDGSTQDIPIVAGQDLDDWTLPDNPVTSPRVAWRNNRHRGLYLTCWRNPAPNLAVKSISVRSANGAPIPFIAGITCERVPDDLDMYALNLSANTPWGLLESDYRQGVLTVKNSEKTHDWAGIRIKFHAPVTLTAEQMERGHLVVEINGGNDPFGNHKGATSLQASCGYGFRRINTGVDHNPNTFQLYRIPLRRWQHNSRRRTFELDNFAFQYTGCGKSAGYQLRNVRLEVPRIINDIR